MSILRIGLFLFIAYEMVKMVLKVSQDMEGLTRIVFYGVSAFVLFAVALKLFGGEEE